MRGNLSFKRVALLCRWIVALAICNGAVAEPQSKPEIAPHEIAPHDFDKWARLIHNTYDDKLAGGYAFEVRHGGKIVAAGDHGWARAPWEQQHPSVLFTPDKPMGIASVSKTITTVGLLRLWEETNHGFSIDDPFWPYIRGEFPDASDQVKKITIRQLLTHRSGFDPDIQVFSHKGLKELLAARLAHEPGAVYHYGNNNFYVCRILIEQIGHVRYTQYIKEHVLGPMGIGKMETHFEADAPTCGYGKLGSTRAGFPFDWQQAGSAGPDGWYGSVADLGRFLNGLREHKVLTEETTQMMFQGLLGWDHSDPCMMKNGAWFWNDLLGHRGGELHSVIAHFPDDTDAVMLCNCAPPIPLETLVVKCWRESLEQK